jgi:hypothetical protein
MVSHHKRIVRAIAGLGAQLPASLQLVSAPRAKHGQAAQNSINLQVNACRVGP